MKYERLHERRLLRILIQSIALLQISLGADVVIISYPELEKDFAEFRTEQDLEEIPDPYEDEVVTDLQRTCADMQYAKTYELLAPKRRDQSSFPTQYSHLEDLTESRQVEDIAVKIDDFEDEVSMLLCYKDPKFGQIYITPGFGNEFQFLLRQADPRTSPKVYGLVEPAPYVDDSFLDQRHLEKFFVQAYRMYDSGPKSDLSLNKLNGNQHYRLCSLIGDARDLHRQAEEGADAEEEAEEEAQDEKDVDVEEGSEDASKDVRKVTSDRERRLRQLPVLEEAFDITFHELDKLNPVYATLERVATLLPCYTNGKELEFLLSEDPLDASAAFVFERTLNAVSGRREISVVQHVNDIGFLRNMDKFYRK